ncbi:regulatory protein RecX [Arthrobacter sp. Ld5]|uniref:regulatory protein RecX n=1 Tax=Arthrobacter sp. Ld5 TaxID=649152 RepID=UPI003EBA73DB
MASETGPDPAGWGTSYGRFGSDASGDSGASGSSERTRSARGGASRSASSFGRSASTRGRGAARTRRRQGAADRASVDDPFGPVVGASADAPAADAPADDARPDGALPGGALPDGALPDRAGAAGRGRRARGGRTAGARRGRRGDAGPGDGATAAQDAPARSDEEWTSLARSVLLRQLALGARSRHQLDLKLTEKEVPPPIATALLDRFEEVHLIDDAEFARMWVRTRTAAKALSRSSLRRELAAKGIDAELAEDALLQLSDEDEDEQAREVVRRKLRRAADLSDRAVRDKEVRRLVGVLARKGYSPGTAFSIVKDVLAEAQ